MIPGLQFAGMVGKSMARAGMDMAMGAMPETRALKDAVGMLKG